MRSNLAWRAGKDKVDLTGIDVGRLEGLAEEDSEDTPAEFVRCDFLSIMGGGLKLTQGVATIVTSRPCRARLLSGVGTRSPSTGI